MSLLNIFFLIPEAFYLCVFFLFLLYPAILYYSKWISVVMNCTFILGYGAVLYILLLLTNGNIDVSLMTFHMCSDVLVVVVKLIISLIFIIVLYMLHLYFFENKKGSPEPFLLLVVFFIGSCFCLMSNDFFFFFLTMELITIISYLLATTQKFSMFAAESSLKYFIQGAMSSSFLLLGFILLYGFTGLTNFFDFFFLFNLGLDSSVLSFSLIVAVILILSGFLFKLSVVPFHVWVPDVYEGSLYPIVLLFSTLTKVVFVFVFFKVLWLVFLNFYWIWESVLFFAGVASVFFGSVAGLLQNSLLRLYAYSTIVNGGFFCCLLGLGSLDGLVFLWNYLFIYIVTSIGLFFVIHTMLTTTSKNLLFKHELVYLDELFKKSVNLPLLVTSAFILIFFSYVGIPPLAGFLAKFFLLWSLYNQPGFLLLFLLVLFSTILTSVYYVRVIYLVFFFSSKPTSFIKFFNKGTAFALIVVFFSLIFFFFLQPFVLVFWEALLFSFLI